MVWFYYFDARIQICVVTVAIWTPARFIIRYFLVSMMNNVLSMFGGEVERPSSWCWTFTISYVIKASKTSYMLDQADGGNTESSGLADLFDAHVSHLSTLHFKFIRHWNRLIDLEAREMKVSLEYQLILLEFKLNGLFWFGDLTTKFVYSFQGKTLHIHVVQRAATQPVIFLLWFLTWKMGFSIIALIKILDSFIVLYVKTYLNLEKEYPAKIRLGLEGLQLMTWIANLDQETAWYINFFCFCFFLSWLIWTDRVSCTWKHCVFVGHLFFLKVSTSTLSLYCFFFCL